MDKNAYKRPGKTAEGGTVFAASIAVRLLSALYILFIAGVCGALFTLVPNIMLYPVIPLLAFGLILSLELYHLLWVYRKNALLHPGEIVFRRGSRVIARYPYAGHTFTSTVNNGISLQGVGGRPGYVIRVQTEDHIQGRYFLPLSRKDCSRLLDALETRAMEITPKNEPEDVPPTPFSGTKEFALRKELFRKYEFYGIGMMGLAFLAFLPHSNMTARSQALHAVSPLIFIVGFVVLGRGYFYLRKMPSRVILQEGFITLGSRTIPIREILSVRAASTLQTAGYGGRKFEIVTKAHGKESWLLGRYCDTEPDHSILPLNDYREIVEFLRASLKNRPDAFRAEAQ